MKEERAVKVFERAKSNKSFVVITDKYNEKTYGTVEGIENGSVTIKGKCQISEIDFTSISRVTEKPLKKLVKSHSKMALLKDNYVTVRHWKDGEIIESSGYMNSWSDNFIELTQVQYLRSGGEDVPRERIFNSDIESIVTQPKEK